MLTQQQLTALKADINAATDPRVVAFRADPTHPDLATDAAVYYNEPGSADGWRSNFTRAQMRAAWLAGASEFDNLETGKRDGMRELISDSVDARDANVRAAFQDFTANRTGGFVATAIRNAFSAAAKRKLTNAERVFATGPTAGAYVTTWEGVIGMEDMRAAMAQG